MSDTGEFKHNAITASGAEHLDGLPQDISRADDPAVCPLGDAMPSEEQETTAISRESDVRSGEATSSTDYTGVGLALDGIKKRLFPNSRGHGEQGDAGSPPDERSVKVAGAVLGLLISRARSKKHKLHLAIEGIDGTGKSTALENVEALLQEQGLTVSTVRYTGKSGIMGKVLSSLYSEAEDKSKLLRAVAGFRPLQAALYATNGRINLLRRQRGTDVLLADRSVLSGYASHVGRVPNWLLDATESTITPDVVAYLDLPLDEASRRINIREEGGLGYEEDAASLQKFRDDYEKVFANPPRRLQKTALERIDASQGRAEVASAIAGVALRRLASY